MFSIMAFFDTIIASAAISCRYWRRATPSLLTRNALISAPKRRRS
jgi:hypothetical protein